MLSWGYEQVGGNLSVWRRGVGGDGGGGWGLRGGIRRGGFGIWEIVDRRSAERKKRMRSDLWHQGATLGVTGALESGFELRAAS